MTPRRIQLRRTRGWRKPVRAVVVSRPSKWGNPFLVGIHPLPGGTTREQAIQKYRRALTGLDLPFDYDDVRRELRGKDLACWCPLDQPCHADVLLEIANR